MSPIVIILLIIIAVVLFVLAVSYACFRMAFYVPRRKEKHDDDFIEFPEGKIYEAYRESIEKWAKETRQIPSEEFSIMSFDGLKLYGKYYEYKENAPIEIMFHGYRSTKERDLSGGVQRCFKLGRSALIVDQRCCGKSEGNVITFGIKEHRDCLSWIDFAVGHFGCDVKLVLAGISMGAATVMIAAGEKLPPNVKGVLADCGFNSAKDIIKKVIKDMGLPQNFCYPFVKLGAFIFGGFNLDEKSAEESLKRCKVPVIFYHGESDDFVPCEMSRICYNACNSRKLLVTVPNAGHGLSYPVDPKLYFDSLKQFFGDELSVD